MTMLPEAVQTVVTWYVLGLAALIGYAYVAHRLRRATHDLREGVIRRLALESRDMDRPTDVRDMSVFLLDNVANAWMAWTFALLMPVFLVFELLAGTRHKPARLPSGAALDRDLLWHWFLSVVSLSPLASLIIVIEGVLAMMIMLPITELRAVGRLVVFLDRWLPASGRVART
jgi:hypothetical protein